MTAFATYADVENVWRPLTTEQEINTVTARLDQASRLIRHLFSTIDTRITAGEIDAGIVRDIAVDMVLRYMRNPDGVRQEAVEDYSYTRDTELSAGKVYLTEDEIALLTPVPTKSSAFSIVPGRTPATCGQMEAARGYQEWWRT